MEVKASFQVVVPRISSFPKWQRPALCNLPENWLLTPLEILTTRLGSTDLRDASEEMGGTIQVGGDPLGYSLNLHWYRQAAVACAISTCAKSNAGWAAAGCHLRLRGYFFPSLV